MCNLTNLEPPVETSADYQQWRTIVMERQRIDTLIEWARATHGHVRESECSCTRAAPGSCLSCRVAEVLADAVKVKACVHLCCICDQPLGKDDHLAHAECGRREMAA